MIGQILGWLGAFFFAFCAVPQAWRCFNDGDAKGLSAMYLWMWFLGEVFCIPALIIDVGFVWWVLFNYVSNLLCLIVILKYKYFPRI